MCPPPDLSGYKAVWIFALFDLPVTTREHRRQYARFRKELLKEGFSMLQYSVYARYCPSEESGLGHRRRISLVLPPRGQVRLVSVTDRQFEKMEVFYGKERAPGEEPPQQLMLF